MQRLELQPRMGWIGLKSPIRLSCPPLNLAGQLREIATKGFVQM
jgi:hypothetical protein